MKTGLEQLIEEMKKSPCQKNKGQLNFAGRMTKIWIDRAEEILKNQGGKS